MKLLRTDPVGLKAALQPIGSFLNGCWYDSGEDGVELPAPPRPGEDGGALDPGAMGLWSREYDESMNQLSHWSDVSDNRRIGRPGFFSRCTPQFHWSVHFAADTAECPIAIFKQVAGQYGV